MTTSLSKKVTVIIPNYNYAKYIKKRLQSVLKQTYPIHEILVLDDHSTDGSAEIAKNFILDQKLKTPDLQIRFVPSAKNSGQPMAAWKKGWELATGDYIWIAEADDLSSPRFLETTMQSFDDPAVVLSYTESMVISGRGLVLAPNFRWSRDKEKTGHYAKDYTKPGRDEISEIMAIRCTIPNVSGVVFRKDRHFLKYLDQALKFAQVGDWYFYTKVLEHGKISYHHQALNKFRVHRDSVTGRSKSTSQHHQEILDMHRYFRKHYDLTPTVLASMDAEAARVSERTAR